MKRLSILFSLLMGLALSQPGWTYKEADLQKLFKTNSCNRCDLARIYLASANLTGANLTGADLRGAKLQGIDLYKADLTGAKLTEADLRGANLRYADLTEANLKWAILFTADLTGAHLCNTTMADGTVNNSGCGVATTPSTPTTPVVKTAKLTIRSNVTGTVYVNNQYNGSTRLDLNLQHGRYAVRVDKSGYYSFQKTVNLQRDTEIYASLTKKEATQPEPTPTPDSPSLRLAGTGTAFVVNKNYLLTASHVIEECKEVSIRHAFEEIDVDIAIWDETNDLGLLRSNRSFQYTAKFRGGKSIRKGDTVVNYGNPLFGELSDTAKISKGEINSLAGMGNDSSVFQYDAATQPGNSGGPVLDLSGNVVGVVSSGLGKKYAEQSGHIVQNVNFAVKSYVAEGFSLLTV